MSFFGIYLIFLGLSAVHVDGQFGALGQIGEQIGLDLNPAHQLCNPCIYAANIIKDTNKQQSVKDAEKKTCVSILHNDLVCNGAVEVAGIYLSWTPSEKICENFRMCGAPIDMKKKLFRSPVKTGKQPNELARRVLEVFAGGDEFPVFPQRSVREAGIPDVFNLKALENFEKLIQENASEINEVAQSFLKKFQKAVEVYTNQKIK